MNTKRPRNKRRHRRAIRGSDKKRTSVTAICRAIRRYPRGAGASVRNIHRIITRNEKGRGRRSVSNVRAAIARGIRMGNIRAPTGWAGFRGIQSARSGRLARNTRGRSKQRGRKGRRPLGRSTTRGRVRAGSVVRRKSLARARSRGLRRTVGRARTQGRRGLRRVAGRPRPKGRRAATRGRPRKTGRRGFARVRSRVGGARGRARVVFRARRKALKRRHRRAKASSSNNSSGANTSDNYSTGESVEGQSNSLWQNYTCVIS